MKTDFSAPMFQGPRTRTAVWKAVHAHIKRKGVWTRGAKNNKGELRIDDIIKRACGQDDWWMDYMSELRNHVLYEPDWWASYMGHSRKQLLETIKQL